MTKDTVKDYTSALIEELRRNDVSGKKIGDAVAQVESHVADSGEEPGDAFGTPEEFAKELARGEKKSAGWPLYVTTAILTVGGGTLLLKGIFGVLQDQQILWGIPPATGVIIGALAIVAWILLMITAADPVKDPRGRQ